jgi:peptide/nickel transport system substrate-binding protein
MIKDNDPLVRELDLEGMSRREFLEAMGWRAAAFAAAPIILEACASGQPASTSATPKKGGHVITATSIDPAGLNPLIVTSTGDRSIGGLIFDALINFDDQSNVIPMLAAEAPKVSSDGLSYTFKLRPGLQWSDGQAFTSDDVVWTYSLIYDPKYVGFNYPRRALAVSYIDGVMAPDAQTIVLKSKSSYAPLLLSFGAVPILPKHLLGGMSATALNTASFNSAPTVASGPFKFSRWDKGSQLILIRNDGYYRGTPFLDSLVWRVVSSTALASSVNTGDTDIALIGVTDIGQAQSGGNTVIRTAGTDTYYVVAFNLDPTKKGSQLFGDQAVRQALMVGTDRKAIGDAIYGGKETLEDSPIPRDSWAYTKPKTQYTFNKAKAEQMLDTAGWKKNAQGIREKNGVQMSFDLWVTNNLAERVTMVEALTNQWKSIGVDARTKSVVFAEWLNQVQNARSFDALLFITPAFGGADPDQVLSFLYASASTAKGGFNSMSYKNTTVDQLLDQAVKTVDRSKRKSIYAQFSDIIMDELPVLPLFSYGYPVAVNKRVRGFLLGPSTVYFNWYFMKDMWVTDGK